MKTPEFFAPSITLPNGISILTSEDAVAIVFADGEVWVYRASGGEFDECDPNWLDYEALAAHLAGDPDEAVIAALMADSI